MNSTLPGHQTSSLPAQRIVVSFEELQDVAVAASAGFTPECSLQRRFESLEPMVARIWQSARFGMQEIINLSDDLLLVRTDFHASPSQVLRGQRWDYRTAGWLYLHFRLDGLSVEETPDGETRTLGGELFFLTTSSHQRPFGRELLDDAWRTVGIACRPSFARRELGVSGQDLPVQLRRFQADDPDVDFWYAGQLTNDMKLAVNALLRPAIQSSIRPVYLRAKVVELVCLAVERLCQPDSAGGGPMRLNQRDVQCLQEARRLLRDCNAGLSLEQLARQIGINRRKLALGFKQVFGVTVGEYYRELRLELARDMLEKQAMPVGEAAAVAGYRDAGSFTKAFRARYGSLPSTLKMERSGLRLTVVKK